MARQEFNSVWDALYSESSTYASYMEFKSALLKEVHSLLKQSRIDVEPDTLNDIVSGNIDRLTVDDLLLILEKAGSHYEVTFRKKAA